MRQEGKCSAITESGERCAHPVKRVQIEGTREGVFFLAAPPGKEGVTSVEVCPKCGSPYSEDAFRVRSAPKTS